MTPHFRAFILLILLFACGALRSSFPQTIRPRERLRGVLSRAKLSPELRSAASIRYSPDGNYLLVQDSAGVMLVSAHPLRFVSYIDAPFSYPARFSADSQTVVLVTYDLFLTRWRSSNGTSVESPQLMIPGGCVSAALSLTADLFVCYTPEMSLSLYRLSDAKRVFSASIHNLPVSPRVAVPLDSHTNFSAPFGFFLSSEVGALANRGLFHLPVWFSADGNFLIAGDEYDSLRVNLATFTKENLASPLHKHLNTVRGLAQKDRALILDTTKSAGSPSLVSFSSGQPLSSFSFFAEQAALCTNTRYAFF